MPPFALEFRQQALDVLKLAAAGESAGRSSARIEWHVSRIELLYELAFLQAFIQWEVFLERAFLRYLCGYRSAHGQFAPVSGQYCKSLLGAHQLIAGRSGFTLWHSPTTVINRARHYLTACPHELIVQSNSTRLQQFAAIRHRIAHGQEDAKSKFDNATMMLCGRRYRASRPGRFLRDRDPSSTPSRQWIEVVTLELAGLASQIA